MKRMISAAALMLVLSVSVFAIPPIPDPTSPRVPPVSTVLQLGL